MAIKNLSYTGKELDEVVKRYKDGYRNISKSTVTTIELKAGKIALSNIGNTVYGESVEYKGELELSPTTEVQTIKAGTFTNSPITIKHINLQEKKSDTAQIITPDDGYYLSKVTVSGKGSEYIGPSYTTVTSKTYMPGLMDQIIAGPKLFSGAQIVKGDPNLIPKNIGKDIKLFGLVGAYAGDVVVKIPDNGRAWSKCSSISDGGNLIITYGNGMFVGISRGTDSAYYSTDGITWMKSSMPTKSDWSALAYGNGKFVAVAMNSTNAAYSNDGITWKGTESYSTVNWSALCYGNGKFVAVADGSDTAQYSTDGINWLYSTIGSSSAWKSICYGKDKFIAAGDAGKISFSYNGIDWNSLTIYEYNHTKIYYANGIYIILINRNNTMLYSYDGISWSKGSIQADNNETINMWNDVCYGNGKFIAGADSDIIAHSTNGTTWEITKNSIGSNASLCYGDGRFVIATKGSNSNAWYSNTTLDH